MAPRLLIVDDEPSIRTGMASYFRTQGYDVDCAGEREEAEALVANVEYAAILLDIRMTPAHGADGLEIVSYARARCPTARIIVLTAYGSAALQAEAMARGADAFLHKPNPLPHIAQVLVSLTGTLK